MGFDLFTSKQAALIGVDVGATAIKMVELNRNKNGLRLERFAIESLAIGIISDGVVVKPDDLTEAIKRCHVKLGSKIKSVAMGLPMEAVFVKRLTVDMDLSESQIEENVVTQLSALMSIDASEINVDFQTVPPSIDLVDGSESSGSESIPANIDKQDVLAIAAKREKIEERSTPIENAGLKLLIIDSESLAMHTALDEMLSRNGSSLQDRNHALVQVSEHSMTLVVLRNGEAIYSRDAAFGFGQLVSDVVMQFGVSEHDAKQIVAGQMDGPDGYESLARQTVESATQEIQRAMQLFMTSTSFVSVEAIHLHGDGSHISGLAENISQVLSVNCEVINPFNGIEISAAASNDLDAHASSLVVACGLAFRRFDL